jgi:hypothetical protein
MISTLSNVPELDAENRLLILASNILESIGNDPGVTASQFLIALSSTDISPEEFPQLSLSAVSIETMMTMDQCWEDSLEGPTIH